MKRRLVAIASIAAVIVIGAGLLTGCGTGGEEVIYDYPEMTELPQMTADLKAYEIPDEVLEQISTEDLLEVVLDYPLHAYSSQWEDPRAYFNFVKYYFNGVQELLLRQDLGDVLALRDPAEGDEAGGTDASGMAGGDDASGEALDFLEMIREDYGQPTVHDTYECQIEPMASEELMELHYYMTLRVASDEQRLQLRLGPETGREIAAEFLSVNEGYYILKSPDGRLHTKKYDYMSYAVDLEAEAKDHILLGLGDSAAMTYGEASAALEETAASQNPSAWVLRLDCETNGYYKVDGSDNILDDEVSCQEAIDAYVRGVEENNREDFAAGILKEFQWEYVEVNEEETIRNLNWYSGDEQMRGRGITTEYLVDNFVVLEAEYTAVYDEEKAGIFNTSGEYWWQLYMLRNPESGAWEVFDHRSSFP